MDARRADLSGHVDPEFPPERDRAAEERDARATEREAVLDARQLRADAEDDRISERAVETDEILAAASERDGRADMRDQLAEEREGAASLESFLHDKDYSASLRVRRAAAMDRADAKSDRHAGASDRDKLSGRERQDPEPGTPGLRATCVALATVTSRPPDSGTR